MSKRVLLFLLLLSSLVLALPLLAQSDPGVRPGAAGAGGPLPSVAANSPANILAFFNESKNVFQEVDDVPAGLGPRFNSRSCAACHAQPAVGGSSPAVNPQVADASDHGATNSIPSFITLNGPVREARFPFFFNGSTPDTSRPNGGVEDLYTIVGRSDANGCTGIVQPSFATAQATNNIIFRIPTPTFGSGLIENIDDSTLLANAAANANNSFGIAGKFNREGNTGTITRFGWKAQNKSLEIFAGEAYLVEQGVSNELFTQERPLPGEGQQSGLPAQCKRNPTPEDTTHFDGAGAGVMSDTVAFAMFMRLLAPPAPSTTTPGGATSINNGRSLFNAIGCNVCHTPTLTTTASKFTSSLTNATATLYSDMEVHHMGNTLVDNVSQGNAGGDEFRTAPLWGAGQRIFFLHDGRTSNIITAIRDHNSSGSEANGPSFNFFINLSVSQQQDVVNFLRSL